LENINVAICNILDDAFLHWTACQRFSSNIIFAVEEDPRGKRRRRREGGGGVRRGAVASPRLRCNTTGANE